MQGSQISFTDAAVQKCPFSAYKAVRSDGPVYRDPKSGFFIVTDYDWVRRIAGDTENFSSQTGLLLVKDSSIEEALNAIWRKHGYVPVPTLVVSDPPDHKFHRSLVDKAFTPIRVRQMENYLESIVDGMIDEFIGKGEVAFLSQMAIKVPLYVIADQLGVPRADWEKFNHWANTVIAQGQHQNDEETQIRITYTICEFQQYIAERAQEYSVQPRECILSDLVNADIDGRKLTMEELVAIVIQLLVAGYETTASTMTAGMLRMIRTPGLESQLRSHPELISNFIEEVLRIDSPIQGLFRRATRDTEIAGIQVPANSIVQIQWGAANHDPAQFPDPETFDVARQNARRHVAFGFGPHVCVGNQLARGELRIAFTRLLTRLKNFRLQEGKTVEYVAHSFAYGVTELYMAFDRVENDSSLQGAGQ